MAIRAKTWRNVVYLLLAFPLGVFYFVFLVTGLSLGFGLIITLVGAPILVAVLAVAYGFGTFERVTTNWFLGTEIPRSDRLVGPKGIWKKVKALLSSSETWRRLLYLFLKFPFGIIALTLLSVTVGAFAMVTAPLFYERSWWPAGTDQLIEDWAIDALGEALLAAVVGVLAGFALLHVCNGAAKVWGLVANRLLEPSRRAAEPTVITLPPEEELISDIAPDRHDATTTDHILTDDTDDTDDDAEEGEAGEASADVEHAQPVGSSDS